MRNAPLRFPSFDDLFDAAFQVTSESSSFPHYDIVELDEYNYRIDLAVAGFNKDNIEISLDKGRVLTVKAGKVEDSEDEKFIHRGIAKRAFEKTFVLAEHMAIVEATMEDGILGILIEKEVPESLKPRQIPIM